MNKPDENQITLFYRVLSLAKEYKGLLTLTLILSVIASPVSMLRPYLLQSIIDDHIVSREYAGIWYEIFLFVGVMVMTFVLRYLLTYYSSLFSQNIITDLRKRLFDHVILFNMSYFDKTPIGKQITRVISDVESINRIFTKGVVSLLADALGVIVIIAIMIYSNWRLALVCLATLPLLFVFTYFFKKEVNKVYNEIRNRISEMNIFLQEHINGIQTIKTFAVEKKTIQEFDVLNENYKKTYIKSIVPHAIFFPSIEFVQYFTLALCLIFGADMVISKQVTIGELTAFPWYLNLLYTPIRSLAEIFNEIQMGLIASRRVFNELDKHNVIVQNDNINIKNPKGKLVFEGVTFSYDGKTNVLKNIDIKIESGKTIAIVGHTGSGKSSIINLLGRFYEFQQGDILIDDISIRDYDIKYLRSMISIVLQDSFLFQGTIFENITLRDSRITEQAVWQACDTIGFSKFIQQLPLGLHHPLSENGSNISVGQKQLISFVRVLLQSSKILILDEATSSIDIETEDIIKSAIDQLMKDRTSIIIAHRFSTILHADQIIVLDKGQIVERGSHSQLYELNGHYKVLYDKQFKQKN